ncbi:tachykinin-4 [Neophocaena asiaeorientalis asiaeorientalis]|uniref:Tachykinin-4 n=1 Tax=Neophocaena asiaeorientalis asiaeorientalis TaxID=1706337 RepID=A0A341BBY6_NEOAA|nr:tachykinin-4 [Neophocaena asiaeorientalis asiaeorientalis]
MTLPARGFQSGSRKHQAPRTAPLYTCLPRGMQPTDRAVLTLLLCLILPLLTGLSACAVAGDKELALDAEAGSWGTVTLEVDVVPSIQLQLWEVKRGKASQFFGLMGKQVGGIPPIQPERRGYQRGPVVQGHLGRGGPSTEGREDEDHWSEREPPPRASQRTKNPFLPTWT